MSATDTQSMTPSSTPSNATLWDSYQQHKAQNRMLFPLEGARLLNVSELELLLASPHSQYLGRNCRDVLQELTHFTQVESIVRNEFAVHEKLGQLKNLNLSEHMGIALNVGGLDLRFFMGQWQHMLAINEDSKATNETPVSYSIQFFDGKGAAIAKVFLRDYSQDALEQWHALGKKYATDNQDISPNEVIASLQHATAKVPWHYKSLADDDLATLKRKWLGLTDIHQFHILLKKLDLDRASSYQQAPDDMAYQLQPEAIERLLTLAQHYAKPIMTFVGNSGVIQIQTGVVHHVKRMGDWINILDKDQTDFTLHLNDKALAQVWCVKRPTHDGIVTCVEGFDTQGASIVTFFGQRQEGEEEQAYWRELTDTLISQYSLSAA